MYEAPSVVELGTLSELTQSIIHKNAGGGDVIVISGQPPVPVPGGSVSSTS